MRQQASRWATMPRFILAFLLFSWAATIPAFPAMAMKGDINQDLKVDLTDSILALQVSAGISPAASIDPGADVDNDGRIGMAEALFAISSLFTAKDITAYSLLGISGTITDTAISLLLPAGTDLSSLVAAFSTTGAEVRVGSTIQTSDATANNFSGPVIYTVTARDGSTKNYTITVTRATTGPAIAGCPIFPATAIFNSRIDDTVQFPVHASSSAWKASVDPTGNRRVHLDWGTNENQNQHDTYWGIPYNVLDGTSVTSNWPSVTYSDGVPDESDCAVPAGSAGYTIQRDCSTVADPRLPIPKDAVIKVEGGYCPVGETCPEGDHHILVVEKETCRLWEAYYATGAAEQSPDGSWDLYGSAAWDLNSLAQRPATWTSVDAAGLPILPLLARVDEANAGEVKHALRVTLRGSVMAKSFVWPARHQAGQSGQIPFGALLRLRADFVIPGSWTTQAKAIATAMKRYGVYVADNGSDMYIQGEPSAQWQEATWDQLQSITLSRFDFVSLNSITTRPGFNIDSLAASW